MATLADHNSHGRKLLTNPIAGALDSTLNMLFIVPITLILIAAVLFSNYITGQTLSTNSRAYEAPDPYDSRKEPTGKKTCVYNGASLTRGEVEPAYYDEQLERTNDKLYTIDSDGCIRQDGATIGKKCNERTQEIETDTAACPILPSSTTLRPSCNFYNQEIFSNRASSYGENFVVSIDDEGCIVRLQKQGSGDTSYVGSRFLGDNFKIGYKCKVGMNDNVNRVTLEAVPDQSCSDVNTNKVETASLSCIYLKSMVTLDKKEPIYYNDYFIKSTGSPLTLDPSGCINDSGVNVGEMCVLGKIESVYDDTLCPLSGIGPSQRPYCLFKGMQLERQRGMPIGESGYYAIGNDDCVVKLVDSVKYRYVGVPYEGYKCVENGKGLVTVKDPSCSVESISGGN